MAMENLNNDGCKRELKATPYERLRELNVCILVRSIEAVERLLLIYAINLTHAHDYSGP